MKEEDIYKYAKEFDTLWDKEQIKHKEEIDARYESNMKILDILKVLFTKYPHLRFCQGLIDFGIIPDSTIFHKESADTLKELKNKELC